MDDKGRNTPGAHEDNYGIFRDSLAQVLMDRLTRQSTRESQRNRRRAKGRKRGSQCVSLGEAEKQEAAEDLVDFIEYIASSLFDDLPDELRNMTYHEWAQNKALQERYALPLTGSNISDVGLRPDPSTVESLDAYGITDDTQGADELLAPVLTSYVTTVSTPPPAPALTRASVTACEMCGRDWVKLTYHHLIPRMVHAKAVKRGWHRPEELQNVAWLCAACHGAVHRFASHEDLARHYYTVPLLLQQDDIVKFAEWASRLRWKKK